MKPQIIRTVGLIVSSLIIAAAIVFTFKKEPDSGSWVSTGSHTLLNTKTGELRDAITGLPIEPEPPQVTPTSTLGFYLERDKAFYASPTGTRKSTRLVYDPTPSGTK